MEGLIFEGAYVRREICVSKSIKVACSGKEIYHVYFVLLCIRRQIPSTSPRGAYIRRGDLTEGFLRYDFGGLTFGGADTWRGLFSEFYGILFVVLGHSFRREAAGAVALVKFKIQCPQFFSKNTFSYH